MSYTESASALMEGRRGKELITWGAHLEMGGHCRQYSKADMVELRFCEASDVGRKLELWDT